MLAFILRTLAAPQFCSERTSVSYKIRFIHYTQFILAKNTTQQYENTTQNVQFVEQKESIFDLISLELQKSVER